VMAARETRGHHDVTAVTLARAAGGRPHE
jgi:hypothetical protein